MRKISIALLATPLALALCATVHAQPVGTPVMHVQKPPVGACRKGDPPNILDPTGQLFTCQGIGPSGQGTWALSSPSPLFAGAATGLGSPEQITVRGNYIYASGDPMGFRVIDITNPSTPVVVGTADAGYSAFGHWLVYPYVYLSITGGGAPGGVGGLDVIDVSNPAAPTVVGSVHNAAYDGSEGIAVSGNFAYIAAGEHTPTGQLDVYNIASPTAPTHVATLSDAAFTNTQAMVYYGNHVYAQSPNGGLVVVDVTTPAAPALGTPVDFGDGAGGLTVNGTHLYVANGDYGLLTILDLTTPATPSIVASLYDSRMLYGSGPQVDSNGHYLYEGTFTTPGQAVVVDVSTPATPIVVTSVTGQVKGDLLDTVATCAPSVSYLYCTSGFLGNGGNSVTALNLSAIFAFSPGYLNLSAGQSLAGNATCWKSTATQPTLGYCSSVVASDGTCTCN